VLKKAGIVVAAAAAGILALTPFAFADNDSHHDSHHESSHVESSHVEYSNVEEGNLTNDCDFTQDAGSIDQSLTGGSSLLDMGGIAEGLIAPVTTQTQLGNCTNVGVSDVIDFDSGNTTETTTETEIDESFNSILEMGFASSIRKEWEWRRARGESTRNLEAFAGWLDK